MPVSLMGIPQNPFVLSKPGYQRTRITESDILYAHNTIGYRSGVNTKNRRRTLEYLKNNKKQVIVLLLIVCRSRILFGLYSSYRSVHAKKKSQLDMYFGN